MQQSVLFDSVVTEAQFEPQHRSWLSASAAVGTTLNGDSAVCFVLMRSPMLSVLLVATPLPASKSTSERAPLKLPRSHHSIGESVNLLVSAQATQNGQSPYLQVDIDSIDSHLPPSEQDLRSAGSTQASAFNQTNKGNASRVPYQPDCEVSLSFDDQTILSFLSQLVPKKAEHAVTSQSSTSTPTKKTASNRKALKREDFVLAWAKQLAVSPEGLTQSASVPSASAASASAASASDSKTQSTLDNQLQQSLLLNQVITRIRHGLDLPAILETTVAQAREFLSVDRLVLYQFDQIEPVDLSSPSSTVPFSSAQAKGDKPSYSSPTASSPTADLGKSSDAIIGRCTHDGRITYESRVSESIPSVLNMSEKACFMPSLSIRSRYITGQPIAIDDVDKQYASVGCLLDFLHQAGVKSKIIAPIVVKEQLWGLLVAHQCDDYRHWEETEVVFLQHIAEHLAVAISQAGLYEQLQKQKVSLESCVVERTQNLHDALLAAESANLTKGEFLSTMSHELRTPLTYIIGMSATLLRWSFGELSDRQRSYLNTINHSGEQLLEIINDILDFAKISSGRTFLDVSEFSLRSLADEIVDHFQSIADKQEVILSLQFDISLEENAFHADVRRLRQIISNLMHNAIKFTPAGGKVSLRVSREGQFGVFQVEDTGIGISESQRGLLFEKFKQLESPFQRQYSGTGLGLAMTKRLVELHGGMIQVRSIVGEGSVFSVRLPIQAPKIESDRYQVSLAMSDRSKRILLLEVQEDSAAIICDLLTADGYEVIWQEDVDKMLSQLESLRPAMLIADLSLLSHDLEEIKKIQLSITDVGTKVLALLGQPMSYSSHIAHHDTLEKPIDPKKLLDKVRQLTFIAT